MASRIGVSLPVNLHSHDKVPFIDLRHLPKCWDKWLTATTKVTLQEPRKIPVLTKNCFEENLLNLCSRSQKTVDGLVTNHPPAWILGFDLRSLLGKNRSLPALSENVFGKLDSIGTWFRCSTSEVWRVDAEPLVKFLCSFCYNFLLK